MNDDFDADDLRIISYIHNGLNISTLAKKLSVSPQRISQRLTRMEKICRAPLVQRSGGMKLTSAGNLLLNLAQSVERDLIKFKKDLAQLQSDHGQLRIIAVSSILIGHLPPIIETVKKKYPNLRIKVTEASAEEILNSVKNGTADIGLIGLARQIEGLVFNLYKTEKLCLLSKKSHPVASKDRIKFEETDGYAFIGMLDANLMSTLLDAAQIYAKIFIDFSMKVSSLEVAAQMASTTDLGLCLTLESVAQRYAKLNDAKVIELSDPWASIQIATCTREIATRTPAVTYFLSQIKTL